MGPRDGATGGGAQYIAAFSEVIFQGGFWWMGPGYSLIPRFGRKLFLNGQNFG
jgi:hypothetical protein